jgi:hypothetical protein
MKLILAAVMLSAFAVAPAHASCKSDAAAKKLAGAALNSFMTKCERDAKTACEKTAAGNKLAGAAKTSNVNKCVRDNVGT